MQAQNWPNVGNKTENGRLVLAREPPV